MNPEFAILPIGDYQECSPFTSTCMMLLLQMFVPSSYQLWMASATMLYDLVGKVLSMQGTVWLASPSTLPNMTWQIPLVSSKHSSGSSGKLRLVLKQMKTSHLHPCTRAVSVKKQQELDLTPKLLFTLCKLTRSFASMAAVITFWSEQHKHFGTNYDTFRHHLLLSTEN